MKKKYSEIKSGEVFAFGGQNWIRLEEAGLCVMDDILKQRAFDEESNDWRRSELREYLNNDFYETLTDHDAEEKDFLMIETDLIADDGMKDYGKSRDLVSLMTADLYRRNRHLLKPIERWWWLATPHSCLPSSSDFVRFVYSSGTLSSSGTHHGNYGVRPLLNLSPETLVLIPEKEESISKEDILVSISDLTDYVDEEIYSHIEYGTYFEMMNKLEKIQDLVEKS